VVVHNLNVKSVAALPSETDSPLIVHAYAVLALPPPLERLQTITRWHPEITQAHRLMKVQELSPGRPLNLPKSLYIPVAEKILCLPTPERADHSNNLLRMT
jgi:hypothetical protein